MSVAPDRCWPLPCERLREDDVSLAWLFTDLSGGEEALELDVFLAPDEQARAAAHRQPSDRASYRAAHALKRVILGEWLDRGPADLVFGRGPAGKPYLPGHERLYFSLSHTVGFAALACAWDRPVGIDVERLTGPRFDAATAEIALHADERAFVATLPPGERSDARYMLWMLREAHAKATGHGLADKPDQSAFALDPPRMSHGGRPDEHWRFLLRRAGADHMMALASVETTR